MNGNRRVRAVKTHTKVDRVNRVASDVEDMLNNIVTAGDTKDISKIVDAFVAGVRDGKQSNQERTVRDIYDISRGVTPSKNGGHTTRSGAFSEESKKGVVRDEVKNQGESSQRNNGYSEQNTFKEGNTPQNKGNGIVGGKDNNVANGDIHNGLSDNRNNKSNQRKKVVVDAAVGAKAIIAGMMGEPRLHVKYKHVVDMPMQDMSDVHCIYYIGTLRSLTMQARIYIFDAGIEDTRKLAVMVEKYNNLIASKLYDIDVSYSEQKKDECLLYAQERAWQSDEVTEYCVRRTPLHSYKAYIQELCWYAKTRGITDYIIYSNGSVLKLKGIIPNVKAVEATIRITKDDVVNNSDYLWKLVTKPTNSTVMKATQGITMPKIVDALK